MHAGTSPLSSSWTRVPARTCARCIRSTKRRTQTGGAAGFADAVVRAYGDRGLWEQLAANGLDNIATHFSADAARGVVHRVFID